MPAWGLRALSAFLVPAIFIAACILGYYTYLTASKLDTLGAESVAQSTLLLLQEKVDRLEQHIISADNAIMHLIDVRDTESFENAWPALADGLSPSIRAVVVLDAGGGEISTAARMTDEERRDFIRLLYDLALPDMGLITLEPDSLRHLHKTYFNRSYLFSYKAFVIEDERYYVIAYHDPQAIVRDDFPVFFANEGSRTQYNVLDEEGRRIFGANLAKAGEFIVSRAFPTTLYGWRLQIAPELASELVSTHRSRKRTEVSLIALCFGIILLGSTFVVYAASKERKLNALKGEFIANVSHELKTPLSVIRMFSEMLASGRVRSDEKQKAYLDMICRESERLTQLIENVLDFAALERGKNVYKMGIANVADIVARAVDTFRYRVEPDGTEIRFARPTDLPLATVDEQALMLAVINLLDNAVKYGERSAVDVQVTHEKNQLRVAVRDRGPGIAPEDLRRVFERFYRSQNASSQRGSGIGLSLVQNIAEAHGGRAFAQNAEGGGAVVGFTIPALTRGERLDTEHA